MSLIQENVSRLKAAFAIQKTAFAEDSYPSLDTRLERISTLSRMLVENRLAFQTALADDFGSHPSRLVDLMETGPVIARAKYYAKNLGEWMLPRREELGPEHGSSVGQVLQLPKGVCGNISPWNFPVESALIMCIDMMAAGNRVIVKPSEMAPATAQALEGFIAKYFEPDLLTIIQGGPELASTFASMPWDHLTFTGSPRIGKLVLQAAAENMVPVTLELGGKNPALFAPDGVTDELIKLFLSFRTLKSGQVCTSPDYVLVQEDLVDTWVEKAGKIWKQAYPSYVGHSDITGIINAAHYRRIVAYIDEANDNDIRVVSLNGDEANPETRQIPLSLIVNPSKDMACMTDEIFGPVIPVVPYTDISKAIADINAGPSPLASYIATNDSTLSQKFVTTVRSGGSAINNFGIQGGHVALPFGGFGASGQGCHSGKEGFLNYTHTKSVFFGASDSMVHQVLSPPLSELTKFASDGVYQTEE